METSCLVASSVCVNAAAVTILRGHYGARDKKDIQTCSKDLIILMFIGTVLRCYWGHSPPVVWSEEHILLEFFGRFDSFFSIFIWGALLMTVGKAQTAEPAVRPWYAQWNYLLAAAVVIGLIIPEFFPFAELPTDAFPFTITTAVATLFVELSAMIPQTLLTAHGWQSNFSDFTAAAGVEGVNAGDYLDGDVETGNSRAKETETPFARVQRRWAASSQPHFVGFLCLARVFRGLFWLATVVNMWLDTHTGDWTLVYVLVVPELSHSILFGGFLMQWLQRIKETTVDPFVTQALIVL